MFCRLDLQRGAFEGRGSEEDFLPSPHCDRVLPQKQHRSPRSESEFAVLNYFKVSFNSIYQCTLFSSNPIL